MICLVSVIAFARQEATPRTTRDKVYSKEQAARGEVQYEKICASCHDPEKVPPGKKPGPPVAGDVFLEKWSGKRLSELLTVTETTMPNDGSAFLTDDETTDLVAYMLKLNNFPDGPAALKIGESSKDIVIVK